MVPLPLRFKQTILFAYFSMATEGVVWDKGSDQEVRDRQGDWLRGAHRYTRRYVFVC